MSSPVPVLAIFGSGLGAGAGDLTGDLDVDRDSGTEADVSSPQSSQSSLMPPEAFLAREDLDRVGDFFVLLPPNEPVESRDLSSISSLVLGKNMPPDGSGAALSTAPARTLEQI